jgi:hypothetical protein
MEHFYHNIEGMFTYTGFYDWVVSQAPVNAKFVEVGCWKGCSAAYLGVAIVNSEKNIELFCVDSWLGDEGLRNAGYPSDGQFEQFTNNMQPLAGKYKVITGDSSESANEFADGSLDFVYIDAEHTFEAVEKDVSSWLPKMKSGGIISGHDYWPGHAVEQAVSSVIGRENINESYINEFVWYYIVP